MGEVYRYRIRADFSSSGLPMAEALISPTGEYVLHTDFAAERAAREAVEARCSGLTATCEHLQRSYDSYVAACEKAEARADALAAELGALRGWIPVSERLPDADRLALVFWLQDGEDQFGFDHIEEGIWQRHTDHYDWAHSVAPPDSRMPPMEAPYTHWRYVDAPALLTPSAPSGQQEDGT